MADNVPISLDGPRVMQRRLDHPQNQSGVWLTNIAAIFAIVLTFLSIEGLMTILMGATVFAHVDYVERDGGGPGIERVEYSYEINNRMYSATSNIGLLAYHHMISSVNKPDGDAESNVVIPVLVNSLTPSWSPIPMLDNDAPKRTYRPIWAATVLFDLLFCCLYEKIIFKPNRDLDLLRNGSVTLGEVIAKVPDTVDAPKYEIAYRFIVGPPNGLKHELRGKMVASGLDTESLVTRSRVTVVYNPKNPEQSLIYELSDYVEEEIDINFETLEAPEFDSVELNEKLVEKIVAQQAEEAPLIPEAFFDFEPVGKPVVQPDDEPFRHFRPGRTSKRIYSPVLRKAHQEDGEHQSSDS